MSTVRLGESQNKYVNGNFRLDMVMDLRMVLQLVMGLVMELVVDFVVDFVQIIDMVIYLMTNVLGRFQ
jgi:hypothetical protein